MACLKVLITGSNRSGSWQIRGVQLGKALGATVARNATEKQIEQADIVVVIKKPSPDLLSRLHLAKKVVWDTVDPWIQKAGVFGRQEYIDQVLRIRDSIKPDFVICATEKMREDFEGDFTLYHHHRESEKAVIREHIKTVAYDGNKKYLGNWEYILKEQCKRRGWEFVHTHEIHKADICVAFRGSPYDTYATRCWKSNVKLANAQASGVPFVCLPEMGYLETDYGGVMFADSEMQLSECLDCMTFDHRKMAHEALLTSAYSVNDCAKDYMKILNGL